jgi:hypothetical protein
MSQPPLFRCDADAHRTDAHRTDIPPPTAFGASAETPFTLGREDKNDVLVSTALGRGLDASSGMHMGFDHPAFGAQRQHPTPLGPDGVWPTRPDWPSGQSAQPSGHLPSTFGQRVLPTTPFVPDHLRHQTDNQ